jgi:hypothetical protein
MPFHVSEGPETEQAVEQARISNVNLGRLDLTFRDILMPRRELLHYQCPGHQIQIVPNRGVGNPEGPSEFGTIPDLSMVVSQHAPKPRESGRLNGDAELRKISFQERANEPPAPFLAISMGTSKVGTGEATAEPKLFEMARPHLVQTLEYPATSTEFSR